MKRALSLLLVALPIVPFAGCSSSEEGPTYPAAGAGTVAGSSSTGGTGSDTAGTTGTSGSTSTAGTTGTSGSTSTAGTTSTGGSGTSGSGGSGTSGSGGSGTSGSGGSGTSGSGGSAMAGSGGGGDTPVSVGKLDGFLLQTPCKPGTNDDCDSNGWIYEGVTHGCSGGNLDTDAASTKTILDFPITGGVKGKVYLAKMHFYGIMEPKVYGDNIQRESTDRPGQANPAVPAPFAWAKTAGASYPSSDYNTYEIHVIDDTGKAYKDYYLNADTQSGHWTFAIDYEKDIEVVAGGKIHVRSFDLNCRMIKNCGPNGHTQGAGKCTAQARTIPGISAAMPAITVTQPGLGQDADSSGQWFAIDVKTIVPKP